MIESSQKLQQSQRECDGLRYNSVFLSPFMLLLNAAGTSAVVTSQDGWSISYNTSSVASVTHFS